MIGNLDTDGINNLLTTQALGRLACCDNDTPYIVPVTYAWDGKYIYGQTNEGSKLEILRKNPNVCFEIERMTNMANWECVVIQGTFKELEGTEAEAARKILFSSVYALTTSNTIHPFEHEAGDAEDDEKRIKAVMYRIEITTMTGRFEKQ